MLESVPHEGLELGGGQLTRLFEAVDAIVLPVRLEVGTHRVGFGFADDLAEAQRRGASPRVTLRLKVVNYTQPDEFDVLVNGRLLPLGTRHSRAVFIMNNDTWVTHPVPNDLLQMGENTLEISVRKLNPQLSAIPVLENMEILVEYDKGLGNDIT